MSCISICTVCSVISNLTGVTFIDSRRIKHARRHITTVSSYITFLYKQSRFSTNTLFMLLWCRWIRLQNGKRKSSSWLEIQFVERDAREKWLSFLDTQRIPSCLFCKYLLYSTSVWHLFNFHYFELACGQSCPVLCTVNWLNLQNSWGF